MIASNDTRSSSVPHSSSNVSTTLGSRRASHTHASCETPYSLQSPFSATGRWSAVQVAVSSLSKPNWPAHEIARCCGYLGVSLRARRGRRWPVKQAHLVLSRSLGRDSALDDRKAVLLEVVLPSGRSVGHVERGGCARAAADGGGEEDEAVELQERRSVSSVRLVRTSPPSVRARVLKESSDAPHERLFDVEGRAAGESSRCQWSAECGAGGACSELTCGSGAGSAAGRRVWHSLAVCSR